MKRMIRASSASIESYSDKTQEKVKEFIENAILDAADYLADETSTYQNVMLPKILKDKDVVDLKNQIVEAILTAADPWRDER